MSTDVSVNARVTPEVKAKLHALATAADRSEEMLVREAVEQFIEAQDWQKSLIEARLAEARSGAQTVDHDAVERWLASRGTADELPMPGGRS